MNAKLLMYCKLHPSKLYRSEDLSSLIGPYCKYARCPMIFPGSTISTRGDLKFYYPNGI